MQQSWKEVDMRGVDPNMPFYQHMDKYLSVKSACFFDYRVEHDVPEELKECSRYLTNATSVQIVELADRHDPDAILELAVRFLSGCAMRKQSPEGALCSLDALTDPPDREPARSVRAKATSTHIAKAHSCAAQAHYLRFIATPAERADRETDEVLFNRPQAERLGSGCSLLTTLALAAHHANESVKLDLISPAILTVGLTLRDVAETVGVDMSRMEYEAKNFRPLWHVVAQRVEEIYADARKQVEPDLGRTGEYACAAEECGFVSSQKNALRSCAGKCPSDLKPGYCSKECQKKNWGRHKMICKPGLTVKTPKLTDRAEALHLFEFGEAEGDNPEMNSSRNGADDESKK